MTKTNQMHSFHIPVMGTAFTIDSPLRVAKYGISSVISIIDDELIEKMNAFYSKKFDLPYKEIPKNNPDSRAERITSYLDLVNNIVQDKFEKFKKELAESKTALENYLSILPNHSEIKQGFQNLLNSGTDAKEKLRNYIENHLSPGSIDVNIMAKIDKDNFVKNEQLPVEFNDAHAALRGFANSKLSSSIVLSAGLNPRLYSYFENFKDFFPDVNGNLKKKIILKVSDFRSASIQGNYLAKKGLWVSEYRIESGLNCGGHAFATDGHLLGPILEEFNQKKDQLIQSAHELMSKALEQKDIPAPEKPLDLKITVQGGVGTAEEHNFLLDHYKVSSVGWGTPFLLVPEATSVDIETRRLLVKAKEKDLYLSHISPLGIPFNTVRGTTNEQLKEKRIAQNKSGSSCPKKFLALSKEYDEKGICSASKKFQDIKLKDLEEKKDSFSQEVLAKKKNKITEKACLCVGLGNASFIENDIRIKGQAQGVAICPGPNLAYFSKVISLSKMVQHIYGNISVMEMPHRPNMFVKELKIYLDYFKNEIEECMDEPSAKQKKKLEKFKLNLLDGISYYQDLFSNKTNLFQNGKNQLLGELEELKNSLIGINLEPKVSV
ncbi:hypothetical protein APR41_13840 [Salegentibacter salinarum]|uniref:Uncharacterized protein n=1 Tax=Salegentibacter salinarum TaxID=447422 RepID=A0A2N0U0A2_9FLAO|nr:hypothetical protein [Salegentibacter salinarum]PKD20356.1 hypothetical protein APR41_13840 [Salegentibacter salinarum]SKB85746.1 hypothetical protein SAMN05660903_02921 [Salegentibacter salinarum]